MDAGPFIAQISFDTAAVPGWALGHRSGGCLRPDHSEIETCQQRLLLHADSYRNFSPGGRELQWVRPPKSFSAPRATGATLHLPRVQMEARLLLFSSRLWAAFHTLAALFVPAVLDLPWAVVLRFACRALIIGAALFPRLGRLGAKQLPGRPHFLSRFPRSRSPPGVTLRLPRS